MELGLVLPLGGLIEPPEAFCAEVNFLFLANFKTFSYFRFQKLGMPIGPSTVILKT